MQPETKNTLGRLTYLFLVLLLVSISLFISSLYQDETDSDFNYILNVDKYKKWSDLKNIPPNKCGNNLFLQKEKDKISFYAAGIQQKEQNSDYYYVHFFLNGVICCSVSSPLPAAMMTDTETMSFFKSDIVYFENWNNFHKIIDFLKNAPGEPCLIFSADPNISFSKYWEQFKSVFSLFPVQNRMGMYNNYVYICSTNLPKNFRENMIIDHSDANFTLHDILNNKATHNTPHLTILFDIHKKRPLHLASILLSEGASFYDIIFSKGDIELRLP